MPTLIPGFAEKEGGGGYSVPPLFLHPVHRPSFVSRIHPISPDVPILPGSFIARGVKKTMKYIAASLSPPVIRRVLRTCAFSHTVLRAQDTPNVTDWLIG